MGHMPSLYKAIFTAGEIIIRKERLVYIQQKQNTNYDCLSFAYLEKK